MISPIVGGFLAIIPFLYFRQWFDLPKIASNQLQTTCLPLPQSTYITRVPQCLSPRPNWDSRTPSPARECVPPAEPKWEGTHSPAGEGVEGPNLDDWRKSLVLCLLCGMHCTMPFPVLITNCRPLFLQPSHTVHICRCSTVVVLVQCTYILPYPPARYQLPTQPSRHGVTTRGSGGKRVKPIRHQIEFTPGPSQRRGEMDRVLAPA
jgi:hypothetical protein